MRTILMGAVALLLTACAGGPISLGLLGSTTIASSPEADAMRLCGSLVDSTTPGVSLSAIASLARKALDPAASDKLGDNPALRLRKCADMYDSLAD